MTAWWLVGLALAAPADADGDGIPDLVEDQNAEIANGAGDFDTDDDGVPDAEDVDSDGDTMLDAAEGLVDPDEDGLPAYLDPDDDDDGVPSVDELDGRPFPVDPQDAPDTDDDGLVDPLDDDDDGDGIPTATEGGFDVDTDADTIPDHLDGDADGDLLPDADEGLRDFDGDGVPGYLDDDSDGDGFLDRLEGAVDSDGDGAVDAEDLDDDDDTVPSLDERRDDTDGDGLEDRLDDDDDDDGIPTAVERQDAADLGESDVDTDGFQAWADVDADGDEVRDRREGRGDLDGDGVLDYLDPDGAYTQRFRGTGLAASCDAGASAAGAIGWVAAAIVLLRRRRARESGSGLVAVAAAWVLAGAAIAHAAPGDEVSASRGRKDGVVVLYPRIVPATDDGEIQGIAQRLQARLQTSVASAGIAPQRIDVRPAPERVCPRAGCKATSVALLLGHQDGGCAVLAVVGPPGPVDQRLVPLAGEFQLASAALPFRAAPEDAVVVSEFVPCAAVETSIDPAALGQLLAPGS